MSEKEEGIKMRYLYGLSFGLLVSAGIFVVSQGMAILGYSLIGLGGICLLVNSLRRRMNIVLLLLSCAVIIVIPACTGMLPADITEKPQNQVEEQTSLEENTTNELVEIETEDEGVKSIERDVVDLVNSIRAEKGSPSLVWDDELYVYALSHSEDMASQKRLFHSPVGAAYAENAWGGEGSKSWDAEDIVSSWLNSPMHRTWLLCPYLEHIAVGVAYSNNGMYASWSFWTGETDYYRDWWYCNGSNTPPDWWYLESQ